MGKYLVFVLLCAITVSPAVISFAQEEETEYSYGSVIEIKKESNELIISEYDWDNDAEAQVTYIIHPEAEVENAPSWKEIPNGSYVDIEYTIDKNGKKVAKYISVYEPEAHPETQGTEE